MAGQQEELDANEPATPFKLEKAHDRGSIARSAEVNFAVVLLICVACVYGIGIRVLAQMATVVGSALSASSRNDLTPAAAIALVEGYAGRALMIIAPIGFVIWIGATLSAALQARGVFSAQPLVPDFSRINPAAGFQKLLSARALHELWRSALKIAAIAFAMEIWGRHELPELLRLPFQTSRSEAFEGVTLVGSALTLLSGLVLLFALLDWSFTRWDYLRKMRMSRREIKDERKEREGDPRIKARLRELRLEWLRRARQISRVRNADVLLTNPTHYAVALEYRHGEMPAPIVTARGAGELAHRMRLEAQRHGVPVVQNAPLARALFSLSDSQILVPEEHFESVARVLRWVYAARGLQEVRRTTS